MNKWLPVFISLTITAPIGVVRWPAFAQVNIEDEIRSEVVIFDSPNIDEADANETAEEDSNATETAVTETTETEVTTGEVTEEDAPEGETLNFSCQMSEGIPITVAETPVATVPIVRWDSPAIASESTPQADCETSTDRFQTAYDEGLLSYITTGRMNGQLVMCTSNAVNGGCLSRLLDLRATPKPRVALQRVLQIPLPTEGPISDTDCRAYVELTRYLEGSYTGEEDICPPKEGVSKERSHNN